MYHRLNGTAPSWTRSTLTHDQVITWTKAKVHVYSESARLLLKENVRAFRSEPKMEKSSFRTSTVQLLQRFFEGIDGEPIEFERNIFPGLTSLEILQKIQKDLELLKIESSSCQCSVTSIGQRKEIQKDVFEIPNMSRLTRRDSR